MKALGSTGAAAMAAKRQLRVAGMGGRPAGVSAFGASRERILAATSGRPPVTALPPDELGGPDASDQL